MSARHIKDAAEFKALLKDTRFVVTDFYADWCGPCKAIAPFYEKLAAEHSLAGQLAFAKVNVDNVPEVAQEYSVTAMPTFMFFANGSPAAVEVTPEIKSGAVVQGPNGIDLIRGADPRALTAVSAKLGELAKAHAARAAAAAAA
ncbi:thioredoxin-like protein [Niveomyces insectorum RCEF 264]|uniref:Thioredoxin-like protein n=1 Tax=Niveomyces insectorum RCEF 264 TaxID=1081102 RepID=A0A167ZR17_9HYPO|nr:thioredoxin-like protein [Niveomyces insectorum RCEF 264]